MWTNLHSFYTSAEWHALLTTLKMDRLNVDGNLICEYCGKPIVRAYDAIGHHKIELTEENVNDRSISLNPENVAFLHHRCHNYQHQKLGYHMRQVYIIWGAPCSGKTSYVMSNKLDTDLIVDMDLIWKSISGLPLYQKPNKLKAVAFRIRDSLYDVIRYRYGKWDNAYIIAGLPLQAERERMISTFGARPVHIEATEEECIRRAYADELRDSEAYEEYIKQWFEIYSASLAE